MMKFKHPEIGICGLSCRLCPTYHTTAKSKCGGCKSEYRMGAGCPFITCALKKKGVEFCWDCGESDTCEKWLNHREASKNNDSFKCYQSLESDIEFIKHQGIEQFVRYQEIREKLLIEMLAGFNEGRSKSYYCIAATVMKIEELENALSLANKEIERQNIADIKYKSEILHSILDNIAKENNYLLKLRK